MTRTPTLPPTDPTMWRRLMVFIVVFAVLLALAELFGIIPD